MVGALLTIFQLMTCLQNGDAQGQINVLWLLYTLPL